MNFANITEELLCVHCKAYPQMQVTDLFKFLYQSSFGCEHLLTDEGSAVNYINREFESMSCTDETATDELDGAYSRVHLSWLAKGLSAETLGKLFCRSAITEQNGKENLLQKLKIAEELVKNGSLPFDPEDFKAKLCEWKLKNYPSVHHSEAFRAAYKPAYRVISNVYVRFLPLFAAIDTALENGRTVVAIEGGSASGKTTLAKILSDIYDCTVFHMDDFFLRPEQRTPERFAEIGGNVDRERFLEEVLLPLHRKESVCYRRFDCSTWQLTEPETVIPKKLVIVEGAYSMHPELAPYYGVSAFLDIVPEYQRERITKRNTPTLASRFFGEWIPMENRYFEATRIKERCDLTIAINKDRHTNI